LLALGEAGAVNCVARMGVDLMARLTDSSTLAQFHHALNLWNFTGYITWKKIATEWVEANLNGLTTRAIGKLMFDHFQSGGEIDEIPETRPEWTTERFHYDFRFPIRDRRIYIETILVVDNAHDPIIHVVSIHYV
jgi:hypothetical protein